MCCALARRGAGRGAAEPSARGRGNAAVKHRLHCTERLRDALRALREILTQHIRNARIARNATTCVAFVA